MNERYARQIVQVQKHVIRGTDERVDRVLREEKYPDYNTGRWLFQLLAEVHRLDQRGEKKRQRDEVVIDLAEAWTDIAAIAGAAAVSCALVAFEDQEERIEDQLYRRVGAQRIPHADQAITNAASSPPGENQEVPF